MGCLRTALAMFLLASCGDDGAGSGGPLDTPIERWAWIDVPAMKCGNGSSTGIAINRSERSRKLVLAFEGGGACWEAAACYGIEGVLEPTSVHLDGFTEQTFGTVRPFFDSNWAFQRSDAASPFGDATWVFVPYCTGDLHAGTQTTDYEVLSQPRTMHHVGALNVDAMLQAIDGLAADEVFAVGVSAGGYGVQINWERIAASFPGATTHIFADGAQLVDIESGRWANIRNRWAPRFPAGCATCADGFEDLAAHWRAGSPAGGGRHALTASLQDGVLAVYFGYDAASLRSASLAVASAMTGPHAAFMVDDNSHTMIGSPAKQTSTQVQVRDWIGAFVAGTAAFTTVGP